jgi:uncharacterized heparinase superfamily protein
LSRLGRYWKLWHTLPDDERRLRAGRVVERLLRRSRVIRRLGLAPDPPGRKRLERALGVSTRELAARLRRPDGRRGPLFEDLEPRCRAVAATRPDHVRSVLDAAGGILDGRFDLLGSGELRPLRPDGGLDWHRDFGSGLAWPADTYHTDLVIVRGDGSDVKLPWELSRCQHLLVLGQAYGLAPHVKPQREAEALRRSCAAAARSQVDDWIRTNPRGLGVNWTCAMEVALRAVAWLAVLGLLRGAAELDDAFVERVVGALWMHGRHIRGNLEVGADGLTSNHYLADVVGLYALALALPELAEAEEWERFAGRALEEEMQREVHADGVDFERSSAYHRLVAEMFLYAALLARAQGSDFSRGYLDRLARMLEFTATATRDDHSVAQWGDNDDGRLPPLDGYASVRPHDHRHLLALGGRFLSRDDLRAAGGEGDAEALWLLGPAPSQAAAAPAGRASRDFPDAGYYVMRDGDLHCGISCGGVGTRGVGNHSHNDLLSVCVWASGVEWITDPGTGCYTGDPELRNRLRSTAAHGTLQLGAREQNALGEGLEGLFRLHERARPEVTQWQSDAAGAQLQARHHGFGGPEASWVHERTVDFDARQRCWLIHDLLDRESGAAPIEEAIHLRFPLGPGIGCRIADAWPAPLERAVEAAGAGRRRGGTRTRCAVRLSAETRAAFWIALDLPAGSRVDIGDGLYSPRYGVTQSTPVVTATLPAADRTLALSALWAPAAGSS